MSYFLFVDESGHDKKASPYEVLAGVAIRDNHLWPLIQEIHSLEDKHFGRRYSAKGREFKAQKILKTKVFRHLALEVEVANQDRRALAMAALDNGEKAAAREFKALAQAKIAFVLALFDLCAHYGCRAFASIVHPSATPTAMDRLRKDYSYLFERFYYFLQDKAAEAASNSLLQGIVVFDELEKTQSHILVGQMQAYFRGTNTGRNRATAIVPEPFFVHSDLTTGVQIADLIAYVASWGVTIPNSFVQAKRPELAPIATKIMALRHKSVREKMGRPDFSIWSFAVIDDLRFQEERSAEVS